MNKYPGQCAICRTEVPANGGNLVRVGRRSLMPVHLACQESGRAEVIEVRFSGGETMTQNAKGRCIDAPACGCCSAY